MKYGDLPYFITRAFVREGGEIRGEMPKMHALGCSVKDQSDTSSALKKSCEDLFLLCRSSYGPSGR
jgi:hypothetical protein